MKFNKWSVGIGLLALCSVINLKAQSFGFTEWSTPGTAVNLGTNWAIIPAELAGQMNNSQGVPVPPIPVITFFSVRAFSLGAPVLQSYYSTNPPAYFTGAGLVGELTTNQLSWPNGTNGISPPCWAVIHHVSTTNTVSITNVIYGQTNVIVRSLVSPIEDRIADEAVYVISVPATINIITNNVVQSPGVTNSYTTTNSYIAFATAPLQPVNPNDELYIEQAGALISIASQGTITPTTLNSNAGILSGQRRKPFLLTLQSGSTAGSNSIDAINATFVP